MNKKFAQLTVEEERERERAIDFYRYIGKTDMEAVRLAWADIQKACPRLDSALLVSIAVIVAAAAISTTAQQDAGHQKRSKQCGAS